METRLGHKCETLRGVLLGRSGFICMVVLSASSEVKEIAESEKVHALCEDRKLTKLGLVPWKYGSGSFNSTTVLYCMRKCIQYTVCRGAISYASIIVLYCGGVLYSK